MLFAIVVWYCCLHYGTAVDRPTIPCTTHADCYWFSTGTWVTQSDIVGFEGWAEAGCQCTDNRICQVEYRSGGQRGNWFNCYKQKESQVQTVPNSLPSKAVQNERAVIPCISHEDCYWQTTGTTVQQSDIANWGGWLEAGCHCTDQQICQIEYKSRGARGFWFNCYKGTQQLPNAKFSKPRALVKVLQENGMDK